MRPSGVVLLTHLFLFMVVVGATSLANDVIVAAEPEQQLRNDDKQEYDHNSENEIANDNDDNDDDDACGVYFAPSTIPGAGWGVFAAKKFTKGSVMLPGDLIIPIQELAWHNGLTGETPHNLWSSYHWNSRDFPGMELDGEFVTGVAFGVGALPNYHAGLLNMEDGWFDFDRANVPRSDPGAGAFTPFHNRAGIALHNKRHDIPAGMELFIDYGNAYFEDWDQNPHKPLVPKITDYGRGSKLVGHLFWCIEQTQLLSRAVLPPREEFLQQQQRHAQRLWLPQNNNNSNNETNATTNNLQPKTPEEVILQSSDPYNVTVIEDILHVMEDMGQIWRYSPMETMPKDIHQYLTVRYKGLKERDFQRSIRPVEELQRTGFCLDHIREGPSTLPHAGRGAFAYHPLARNQVVAPVPMVHLPDRRLYNMYEGQEIVFNGRHSKGTQSIPLDRNKHKPHHYQLMLNYCFGHDDSTLLLCNYGSGVSLINHSKERANVRLQWSQALSRHYEWLEMPLENWTSTEHAGLAMELVATRDIARGEEIFLDYGDGWEAAWKRHVDSWEVPPEAEWYQPANELNEFPRDPDFVIRTVDEGGYGDLLDTWCWDEEEVEDDDADDDDSTSNKMVNSKKKLPRQKEKHEDELLCDVVERYWTEDGYRYTVKVYEKVADDEEEEDEEDFDPDEYDEDGRKLLEIRYDVHPDLILFEDKLYSRDHLQPWSFRHHIGFPDDLFPEAWRNLKVVGECT